MHAIDLFFPLLGYLIGSFPTGVVLSRNRYGIDVREMGSGNIGATNITRNFGWYAGVVTFLVDFLKGWLPVLALRYFFPDHPWWQTATATMLVLGHCFSAYLRLRGGKGVATSLGVLMAVDPLMAALAGGCYVLMLVTTRISAIGSLTGISAAVAYVLASRAPSYVVCLMLAIAAIVLVRHRSNLSRLFGDLRRRRRA